MIYLTVSYEQKEEAKSMGAKWDPNKKLWYAPDSSFTKLIETYPLSSPPKSRVNKLENSEDIKLIGENRSFGGNELFVDLLPKSSSITLKQTMSKDNYSNLKNLISKRINNKCEICLDKDDKHLQLCERFSYHIETNVQKLERVVGLCKKCYQTVRLLDKGVALRRLIEINNLDKEDAKHHILNAYDIWKHRSTIQWNVDLSIILGKSEIATIDKKIKINKLSNSNIIPNLTIKTIDTNHKIKIHKLGTQNEKCIIDD
jgi:hypothetical protein